MTGQHPAVTFLLAAHERAVALAEEANRLDLQMHPPHPVEFILSAGDLSTKSIRAGERFIEANMPEMVLLRVAEERTLLAEHEGSWPSGEPEYGHHHEVMVGPTGRTKYVEMDDDEPIPPYMCITCEAPGYPCRTVIGLAKAWGWKEPSDG